MLLQLVEIAPGEGPTPKAGDIVNMDFIVTLPDGTPIANSFEQGQPAEAVMGREQKIDTRREQALQHYWIK